MNHSEISSFIWGTADLLRSSFKQHQYGDIILPFTVMRRLDVVLESTKQAVIDAAAKNLPDALRDTMLKQAAGVDFYNTSEFTMRGLLADADGIRENLTKYVTSFSPEIADIFEKFKIFDVIKNLDDNDLLFLVVERFCSPHIDLSPASISNADMGDIYEELIRKFSEVSNETAGEHFSPRDGLRLAAELLVVGEMDDLTQPNRIVKVCDPCAGTGGALTVFADRVAEINPQATVVTYAQEINGQSYAICKSDTILKGGNIANVHLGDTLADDQMPGETFGYQISNPPYGVDWKKSQAAVRKEHEQLGFAGRFGAGLPRISDGQLLFVQHMVAKMRLPEDGGGRIAVFLNGSPLFTGAAGSGESEVRRYLLQHDLVDAIVAMPNDFFFNTGIATYIWVLDNTKEERRRGKVQLINANGIFNKMRKSLGSKRNEFSDEQISQIVALYEAFEDANPKLSKVFANDDFGYITVDVRRPQIDEAGEVVRDKKGRPVANKELNDTENIPLTESVDDYMAREVLPHAPDAWIEPRKQKKGQLLELRDGGTVGYEIPFTRHFYEYTPLRPSADILAEIRELEASIAQKISKSITSEDRELARFFGDRESLFSYRRKDIRETVMTPESAHALWVSPSNANVIEDDNLQGGFAAYGETDQLGAFSFYDSMKPPALYSEQVDQLISHGLTVDAYNRDWVAAHLAELNYYRLRGYWLTLERDGRFKPGTSMQDILDIAGLDAALRQWIMNQVEIIEIRLRSQFAYFLANEYGPLALETADPFKSENKYNGMRYELDKAVASAKKARKPFVTHNLEKYGVLPVWAAVELMTFGVLSRAYGNIKNKGISKAIANEYGTNPPYLKSWIEHLSYIRNICAHFDRLYNRSMTKRPRLYGDMVEYASDKQFPTFVVLARLCSYAWPKHWAEQLSSLRSIIERYHDVDLSPMCFPENWHEVLVSLSECGGRCG